MHKQKVPESPHYENNIILLLGYYFEKYSFTFSFIIISSWNT